MIKLMFICPKIDSRKLLDLISQTSNDNCFIFIHYQVSNTFVQCFKRNVQLISSMQFTSHILFTLTLKNFFNNSFNQQDFLIMFFLHHIIILDCLSQQLRSLIDNKKFEVFFFQTNIMRNKKVFLLLWIVTNSVAFHSSSHSNALICTGNLLRVSSTF